MGEAEDGASDREERDCGQGCQDATPEQVDARRPPTRGWQALEHGGTHIPPTIGAFAGGVKRLAGDRLTAGSKARSSQLTQT
jgi:hypothetical protein